MPQRKPYNPNTAYGRRKLREQAQETYNNLTPGQQAEWRASEWMILISIIVVVGIIFLAAGNGSGFLKWLTR